MTDRGGFQTQNQEMQTLLKDCEDLSQFQKILITGEIGSGKKQLAQYIIDGKKIREVYRFSQLPDNYLKANLVAVIVEQANDLSVIEQQELLQKMVQTLSTDKVTWIILANEKFEMLADKGLIDQRLIWTCDKKIKVPSLKERSDDLDLICEYILQTYAWINGKVKRLSTTAKNKIRKYDWPGNVAELEEVLEKAIYLSQNSIIDDFHIQEKRSASSQLFTLAEMEKKLIFQTLEITKQNRTKAASILGISIRTLRNKLSQYKVEELYESNV